MNRTFLELGELPSVRSYFPSSEARLLAGEAGASFVSHPIAGSPSRQAAVGYSESAAGTRLHLAAHVATAGILPTADGLYRRSFLCHL